MTSNIKFYKLTLILILPIVISAQSILPPIQEWHGKSEGLVAKANDKWITPTERADFTVTPNYNETVSWLKKLCDASPLLSMISIGKSPEGRDIYMVIGTKEKALTPKLFKKSGKPTLLAQAGIHSGEIDGKDAGMMLLRDIAFGNKKYLLDKVNLLFIPILNVDGHERSSSYNRPNQRGPLNMGWRTNAQNLNLNRDYTKLDTRELRAVVKVINDYDPLLYMDIHVTDGADYQYDITFGGWGGQGYSPAISNWLSTSYKSYTDKYLSEHGHIPGQLINAMNDRDFSEGNYSFWGEPRFSDSYGDLRHMASILVENHSLKPFKQRVLGTYILLEATMKVLADEASSLKLNTASDKSKRLNSLPLDWQVPKNIPDSMQFLGIESKTVKSSITNAEFVEWTGKPYEKTIANYKKTEGINFVNRPKGYYVPASRQDVIERLKIHGIQMEILNTSKEVSVEMFRIQDAKFQSNGGRFQPFEGRSLVSGNPIPETRNKVFEAGSVFISTDQPLGELAMILLEPKSPDSFLSWGFFNEIFQRTEYMEAYVMEPTIEKMLADDPKLKQEFEQKKSIDEKFASNPRAIYEWFYSKSKYYDDHYLLYPIGRKL